ncbi:ABC transporter substrate-binding protein [Streptomyces sp. NPDC026673]|uniref:ABC transporter substrate-binding protein n=1 Tax=Streptomyces sp. NPDC026673 TaxID=3155724 RepID=UPI0033CC24E8
MNRILSAALVLTALAALAACGADGSSARSAPAGPASAAPPTTADEAPLPRRPGSVTIGSAAFPESELLAHLYAGAMRARGVTVRVHADIGERAAYLTALQDGSIGAVPEYTGAALDYLSPRDPARAPSEVYGRLRQAAAARGLAVTAYAPAQDADTITVTKATAARYHLRTIGDLRDVAGKLTLGAPAPLRTVSYGVPALKRVYGVVFGRFVPLAPTGTITQTALRNGTVDAADIFSTDPAIARHGLVTLEDPEHIFAAQNVVPLFKRDVLTQPMADACDEVSAKLTTAVLGRLDAQVADGTAPATVAARWLASAGIAP